MPVIDVFSSRKYMEVINDTWGHLKQNPGVYDFSVTIVIGGWGDYLLVSSAGIQNSPWEYEFNCLMLSIMTDNYTGYYSSRIYLKYHEEVREPGVYKLVGTVLFGDDMAIKRVRGTVKMTYCF